MAKWEKKKTGKRKRTYLVPNDESDWHPTEEEHNYL